MIKKTKRSWDFSLLLPSDFMKILVTDAVHPVLIEGFQSRGWEVDYQPDIQASAVVSIIGNYEGLIINSKIRCDADFLNRANRLRFIGRLGSGREVIDIPYALTKNIRVYFSPEGNKNAVAEHIMAMLLAWSNQLILADREVKNFTWHREARRGWELGGKTLGIIGFGHTGSQLAKKLQGWDIKVLAYDKYLSSYLQAFPWVEETTLEAIQLHAEIISFHLPLSAETNYFVDRHFIEKCIQKPVLINTSRGQVIHTADLIAALDSGMIRGACLDVFENEKPSTYTQEEKEMYQRLYQFPQVLLSPHIAGWTHESKYRLAKVLLDKSAELIH
jgi:D-3-phosphoglycerate dehydrogenase / 2-oxoglutarate reductase